MFSYNEEIKAILMPHVNYRFLEGYFGGVFNSEKDKIFATTLVEISAIDYDDFEYLHDQIGSHSAHNYDWELGRKYNSERSSYTNKSSKELIEEGIYKYFSITFICMLHEKQWFILKCLGFYGNQVNEDGIKKQLAKQPNYPSFWEQDLFKPYQTPDYLKEKFEAVSYKDAGMEEFKKIPYLVALLKKEKKEKINHAWCHYFNEEFILPFFDRVKVEYPTAYRSFGGLRYNFTMIYPQHKTQVLFCALIENENRKHFLNYFVFDYRSRKFYKWNYFKPVSFDFSFFYGELIIDDLKQISHWDDQSYLDSSCTMDDDNFWNNYVFAKNNGEHIYLEEI